MDLPVGTRLSLFPLGAVSGTSDGLRWPIDGLSFAPDGTIGTSNEVTGPVHLTMNAPKMLIILPAEMLEAVMQAMVETPEGWHVCT
jgi:thiamine pyrophosphokinase